MTETYVQKMALETMANKFKYWEEKHNENRSN